ncbi:sigma-70 family RNA polymerase sigma factor [Geminisphaera colitermitum]|uniref:sigma-70 family RNA polymerase sigma factor n=1 Tax=Geminisphaera colitermitum TaxID=1148786 RepID=UPI000158C55C|nr:FliA/WhiG family RNA polymerase sigma factor [Geminisphaera colitermitum]
MSITLTEISSAPPPAVVSTAWRAYQHATNGADRDDEQTLIERYLPLVRNVVDRIKMNLPAHVEVEDLYSVGVTGLLAAIQRYDPEQGNTFAGYATLRIRGAVLDELRRLDWCPRRARAKARKIKDAIGELEQRHGRAVTDAEVSEHLGISLHDYAHWLEESRPVTFVAIDQPASGDDGGSSGGGSGVSLHEVIADKNDTPVRERMEKEEVWQLIAQRITELPDIQKRILAMYYFENMRLAEIAAVFRLTESRICQIHSQAVLTLRAYILRAQNR